MPVTYEPIATTTLTSASSTITFNSIPGTYTDLRLVLLPLHADSNIKYLSITYNSNSTSIYTYNILYAYRDSRSRVREVGNGVSPVWATPLSTSIPQLHTVDIFQYASTSHFKTSLVASSADLTSTATVERQAALFRSTSAITSISIIGDGNLGSGTTATLYGIKAA